MQATLIKHPAADLDALNWAKAHVSVDQVEQIRSTDWARTFQLGENGSAAFLKVVPANRFHQLARIADIAKRFPAQVPQVLAFDAKRGWLLTANHGGHDLDDDDDELQLQLVTLVRGLAEMQSLAASDADFLASLERFEATRMAQQLLQFLELDIDSPGKKTEAPLGAACFIGSSAAQRYLRLLRPRIELLVEFIGRSSNLPATLVHGDLHTGNAAVRDDGSFILLDWDECASGPAGSCIHGLFNSATVPAILLSRWAATGQAMPTPPARMLAAYVEQLVAGGYASQADLLQGLPGAICAGQIRFILTYGQFPHTRAMKATAEKITDLLDDLLDLCDWLCASDHDLALSFVADYSAQQEWQRAQRLQQDQVTRFPDRPDLLAHFGSLSRRIGEYETAVEAGLEAVRLSPEHAPWRLELARTYLEQLDLDACHKELQAALLLDRKSEEAISLQARHQEISAAVQKAAEAGGWPQVKVSAAERAQGHLNADTKALLLHLFAEHGVVQIDEVYEPAFVESLHQTFLERYQQQLDEKKQQNHLQVGDKRFMLTLEMDDVFGSPDFIASPMLLPVMHGILGEKCILSAYTAVISLPGSEDQQLHKDHTPLFDEPGWGLELPCFAAQIILPLVRMDETTGTTRCYKDTQGVTYEEAEGLPTHDPIVPLGSCLMLDYATVHQGLANLSAQVRPIVALAYSRPWFRDIWNYHLQPSMRFSHDYFEQAPQAVRKLIAWREIERRTLQQDKEPVVPAPEKG